MIKKTYLSYYVILAFTVLATVSCDKGDEKNGRIDIGGKISTLFVSNGTSGAGAGIGVFSLKGDDLILDRTVQSDVVEGEGITTDDAGTVLIQVGLRDKQVRIFNTVESIAIDEIPVARFTVNEPKAALRGVAYAPEKDVLFIASSADSMLYLFSNPTSLAGAVRPSRKIFLGYAPWDLEYDESMGRLFIAKDSSNQVKVYQNPHLLTNEQQKHQTVSIFGLENIHGLDYSSKLNMLAITDVGNIQDTTGFGFGAVHIIKDIEEILLENSPLISPTFSYENLVGPVDVAIDDRDDFMEIIVAEKGDGGHLVKYSLLDNKTAARTEVVLYTVLPSSVHIFNR